MRAAEVVHELAQQHHPVRPLAWRAALELQDQGIAEYGELLLCWGLGGLPTHCEQFERVEPQSRVGRHQSGAQNALRYDSRVQVARAASLLSLLLLILLRLLPLPSCSSAREEAELGPRLQQAYEARDGAQSPPPGGADAGDGLSHEVREAAGVHLDGGRKGVGCD